MGKDQRRSRPDRRAGGYHGHREQMIEKILKVCRSRFLNATSIAVAMGMPVNSVRAHYLYRMAREGLLETMKPLGAKNGQAYRAKNYGAVSR